MFKHPFSFHGRISAKEYGRTFVLYILWNAVYYICTSIREGAIIIILAAFLLLSFIPFLWFWIAQNTKRCHDLGKNGFWQLIPFYWLWLLTQKGDPENNKYGDSPE